MPLKANIDPIHHLTTYTATGEVTFDDIRTTMESLTTGSEFRVTKNTLWDLRDASISALSSHDIQEIVKIAKENSEARKGGKEALVASKDVSFGLSMVYRGYAVDFPYSIQVFRTMEEALLYLTETE